MHSNEISNHARNACTSDSLIISILLIGTIAVLRTVVASGIQSEGCGKCQVFLLGSKKIDILNDHIYEPRSVKLI